MQKFKPCLISIMIAMSTVCAPLSMASEQASASATGNASNQASQIADHSAEDMVAIAQAGQQNEAINDAIWGNDAIRNTLPQINGNATLTNPNINGSNNNVAVAVDRGEIVPRQSTAPSVEINQLDLNSPVVDQANVLSASEKQRLTQQLRSIYQRGLAQVSVVIVPTTNGQDPFSYGFEIAEKWELGSAETDDGLLILVAVNDRDMYIFPGYGLEGVIPDSIAKRIITEDITPYFKQGEYGQGLIAGVSRIEERLTADPAILAQADATAEQRSRPNSTDSPSPIVLFFIALFAGSFITAILGRILGSLVTAGGFFFLSIVSGGGFFMTVILTFFLWMFLIAKSGGGGRGGRGRRGRGIIFLPGGGFGGGGGGGFGGGGFGGGGFGGGGGGFGGGGAGGSW